MARDFGDEVLPIPSRGRFHRTSIDLSRATFTWNNVLDEFHGMLAPMRYGVEPVWTLCGGLEGYNAVVMFIPSKSVAARNWTVDMRDGLGFGGYFPEDY